MTSSLSLMISGLQLLAAAAAAAPCCGYTCSRGSHLTETDSKREDHAKPHIAAAAAADNVAGS